MIEGNGSRSLLLFSCNIFMVIESQLELIDKLVGQVLETEPEYFKVGLKIKPTNNIKLYLDGDNGITIEKCIQFNRSLYALIEESGLFPTGDFSLEVSSPGIDTPLQLHRQYVKNKGRLLEVELPEEKILTGKLMEIADDHIEIEITTGKGKKAVTTIESVPFYQIKKATVQIQF